MVSIATLDNALSEHPAFIPNRPDALAAMRQVWGAQTMGSAIRKLGDIASAALVKEFVAPAERHGVAGYHLWLH